MAENYESAAQDRFADARILLVNHRRTGAVYMARLGLECTLKHLILRRLRRKELPPGLHTHDLWRIIKRLYRRLPKEIAVAVAQINAVDVSIRYNEEAFDQESAERMLARIQGVRRWLTTV